MDIVECDAEDARRAATAELGGELRVEDRLHLVRASVARVGARDLLQVERVLGAGARRGDERRRRRLGPREHRAGHDPHVRHVVAKGCPDALAQVDAIEAERVRVLLLHGGHGHASSGMAAMVTRSRVGAGQHL